MDDQITLTEAAKLLGITSSRASVLSRARGWQRIADGKSVFVSRSDVLVESARRSRRAPAALETKNRTVKPVAEWEKSTAQNPIDICRTIVRANPDRPAWELKALLVAAGVHPATAATQVSRIHNAEARPV